jgi:hypothetical protein
MPALRHVLRNLRACIAACDTEPVEWLLSLALMVYGGTLLLPFHTFGLGVIYQYLSGTIPEPLLGAALTATGLAGAAALAARSLKARRRMAMLNLMVYIFLSGLLIVSLPFTLANLLLVFVGASLWCYLRLAMASRNGQRNP